MLDDEDPDQEKHIDEAEPEEKEEVIRKSMVHGNPQAYERKD